MVFSKNKTSVVNLVILGAIALLLAGCVSNDDGYVPLEQNVDQSTANDAPATVTPSAPVTPPATEVTVGTSGAAGTVPAPSVTTPPVTPSVTTQPVTPSTPVVNSDAAVTDAGADSTVQQPPDSGQDANLSQDSGDPIPVTGTFPPVDDPWAPGPYTARTVDLTGPAGAYTLYHPDELAPNEVPNPIITWGNGGATVPQLYPMLPHFATHGFVVIASNNPMVTGADMSAGVDWLVAQNEDASSQFYNKLNIDKVGAMGYSNGSLAIYQMIEYPRLVTTVHMSGGIISGSRDPVLKEPGPTAYFCDEADTKPNCDADYAAVQVPVFYGGLPGAVHITMFMPPYSDYIAGAAVAWFRWYLMDDESQRSVFVGDDCQLCQDPAWNVQQKNW